MFDLFTIIYTICLLVPICLLLYFSFRRRNKSQEKNDLPKTRQTMNEITTYHCSTELLHRLADYLIDDDGKEKFCHVTGIKTSPKDIVLTSIITSKMLIRSVCYAESDIDSLTEQLQYLDKFGHSVYLQAHRHPGKGGSATHPSSTDNNNHRIWEVCYPMIGAIFVEDGYFRFFSYKKKFFIKIHGKGVKRVAGFRYCFDY